MSCHPDAAAREGWEILRTLDAAPAPRADQNPGMPGDGKRRAGLPIGAWGARGGCRRSAFPPQGRNRTAPMPPHPIPPLPLHAGRTCRRPPTCGAWRFPWHARLPPYTSVNIRAFGAALAGLGDASRRGAAGGGSAAEVAVGTNARPAVPADAGQIFMARRRQPAHGRRRDTAPRRAPGARCGAGRGRRAVAGGEDARQRRARKVRRRGAPGMPVAARRAPRHCQVRDRRRVRCGEPAVDYHRAHGWLAGRDLDARLGAWAELRRIVDERIVPLRDGQDGGDEMRDIDSRFFVSMERWRA